MKIERHSKSGTWEEQEERKRERRKPRRLETLPLSKNPEEIVEGGSHGEDHRWFVILKATENP